MRIACVDVVRWNSGFVGTKLEACLSGLDGRAFLLQPDFSYRLALILDVPVSL